MRVAIARRKWHTDPDSTETDLQNTLVHEFGHLLGLGHPWNALELDLDVPGSAPLYCRYAIGPQEVPPGATVGVMSYFYLLGDEPNDGTGRSPWRDDIEGVTIAHGERALAGSTCRTNDQCDDCPPEAPGCGADERVCVRVDSSADACQVDADCPADEFCEYVVQGPDTDRPDLDSCSSDDDCKSGYACDLPSGKCVQDEGRCIHRECAVHLPEASTVAYWQTSGKSHDWDGPFALPVPGGGFGSRVTSIAPIAASAADDFDGRRVTVATVNRHRNVEHYQALDGAWCSELDEPIVLTGAEGRTYARPAAAAGGGRAMVAWLADEQFDSFSTRLRFAIRDTFGVGFDTYGEFDLPGYAKRISLGYAEGPNRFIVGYLTGSFRGRVVMVNPQTGGHSSSSAILRNLFGELNFALDDIGRPSCAGDDCVIPIIIGNAGMQLAYTEGEAESDEFDADLGDPTLIASGSAIGRAETARRGKSGETFRWFTWLDPEIGGPGDPIPTEFFFAGFADASHDLPWIDEGEPGPGLNSNDTSPSWSVGTGTYAGINAGDSMNAVIFRGVGLIDGGSPSLGFPSTDCCTETLCAPPDPADDPAFDETGCDPEDESTFGEAGCPCAATDVSLGAVENCSLAGFGPFKELHCQPVHPDGLYEDKFCWDGSGANGTAVVCGETPAGNHICKECGFDAVAFGCPCDEADCDLADLSCWGDDFDGKCWAPEEPPDWVCIERCELISFFDDAFKSVCVGPHLGDQYEQGSAYYLTNGAFQGHPAYCTSIDCGPPGEADEPGFCEEESFGGEVCVAEDSCGTECLDNQECVERGYPEGYVCVQSGINRCLPLSACDAKPSGCP
jgi:hypothetical protein